MTNHCKSCTCPQEKPVACTCAHDGNGVPLNHYCDPQPQTLVPVEELDMARDWERVPTMVVVAKLNEVIARLNLLANK